MPSARSAARQPLAALAIALTALATAACGGSSTTETLLGPTAKCSPAVRPSATAFGPGGGTGELAVTAARECQWSATSESPWVALRPASGQGDGAIQFSVGANEQAAARSGAIAVNEERIALSQDPAPCRILLSGTPTLTHTGGDGTIGLTTRPQCAWTATVSAGWIALREPVSGRGSGEIRFAAAPNPGAERSAVVRVGGIEQPIVQSAPPGQGAPAPPPSCSYSVTPSLVESPAGGGPHSVTLTTGATCSWTASATALWIVMSTTSGAGGGDVRFTIQPNTGAARQAAIQVGGRAFTVVQAGASSPSPSPPAPTCAFELDPTSASFEADGGDGRIRVRTTDACAWNAASQSSWIGVTAGANGTGSGEVRFHVAANAGAARAGALIIAGKSVAITQAGRPPQKVKIDGSVTSLRGVCPAVVFTLEGRTVQTNVDTRYEDGSCAALRNGLHIEVEGVEQPGDPTILALRIKMDH